MFCLPDKSLASLRCCFLAAAALLGRIVETPAVHAAAPDCTAAELLPATVIAVAEIPQLKAVVDTVVEHPLRDQLEKLPVYATLLKSTEFQRLRGGLSAFEGSMQQPWREALQSLTAGGITIALDTQTNGGIALLAKSSNPESLVRFRDFLLALQLLGGKSAAQGDYRGFTVYNLAAKHKMVLLDNWFLLVNKPELGKTIIDQYLDRDQPTLTTKSEFVTAADQRQATPTPPTAWAFLDLAAIRQAGLAKGLFAERSENFFAEAVAGGILANLRQTPFATFALNIQPAGVQLQIATPHRRQWEPPREYLFGDNQPAVGPPLLEVKQQLFALSTYRDLSQLWLRSGELVGDRAAEQLAQADTQLTTFFSGRDFGTDILGSLQGEIQIVAQRQDYAADAPQPAIKLPALAARFRMKEDAAAAQSELRRVFQSFIGFLNVTGAQQGQPQFDLGAETVGRGQLYTATYVPNTNLRDRNQAPINFNFSPSLGFVADTFILASTASLGRELLGLSQTNSSPSPAASHNTWATLDASVLRAVLDSNREQLVANNMLEKGNSPQAAEAEIGLLLELISFLRDANLSLDFDDAAMQVQLDVIVNTEASPKSDAGP